MTPLQQRRFYFPAWSRAFAANWRRDRGAVLPLPGRRETEWVAAVEAAADALARQAHRGLAADDLRHGGHIVALGRDRSSKALDNRQLDRVVALWRLLADAEDLSALMAWGDPDGGERRRLLWWLEARCLEGYVRGEAARIFGAPDFAGLSLPALRALARHMRARPNGQRAAVEREVPF